MRCNNLFIVYVMATACFKDYDDFEQLFGEDAQAVIEELEFWDNYMYDDGKENSPFETCRPSTADEPPSKQAKVSDRFAIPTSSPERRKAALGVIPYNTECSTRWALKNFNLWCKNRAAVGPEFAVPSDLLRSHDPDLVCKYLCFYMMETRREDGGMYPPSTLRSLISGVNRILQANKAPFSVLDRSNPHFRELLNTLDSLSSNLHRDGVGVTKDSAPVISFDHEDLFWKKGLLGFSSPKVLQHTVFFYVGLNFVLRGSQEQYDLVVEQLKRVPPDFGIYDDSVYYQYTEFISKNNQHRFKDINSTNKEVRSYAQPGRNCCLVKLLDTYLKYHPTDSSIFYLRPLASFKDGKKSFSKQRVGINTLRQIVPEICKKSECGAMYTNHSLRATSITRMFNNGIPEKVIAETSGHKSVKALRCYEHTSSEQQKAVTSVVNNRVPPVAIDNIPVVDVDKDDSVRSPPVSTSAGSIGYGFTGSFSHCTFNLSK